MKRGGQLRGDRLARRFCLGILILGAMLIGGNDTLTSPQSSERVVGGTVSLPTGNWTQISHPGWIEDAPVNVYGVLTKPDRGLTITATLIQNLTNKTVTAVKLAWYILSEQTGNKVLRSGETPLIGIPQGIPLHSLDPLNEPYPIRKEISSRGGIPPKTTGTIEYDVVSFANEAPHLSPSGSLTGDYHIVVFVAQAHFDDGTIFDSGIDASFVILPDEWWDQGGGQSPCRNCPNQVCQFSSRYNCYQCVSSPCQGCQVQSCGACLNVACSR